MSTPRTSQVVGGAELVARIWERDASVWTGRDEAQWLGWLDEPRRMRDRVAELERFAEEVGEQGFDACVLLGMGGSSLAPEVLRRAFRSETLHVLDTTHPEAIRALERSIDVERTLFVAASKSGTTLETLSHLEYFWERSGRDGGRFAAITDPGSSLERIARDRGFRAVFPGEPTIGGRYSALSPFGLVPAAIIGVDLGRLLDRTDETVEACRGADDNPGLELGVALGESWREGRDKVVIHPNPAGFGLWVEQLLAESTGKEGKGLVPVPDDPSRGPDVQVHEVHAEEPYEVGSEFFRWEFATAVAGSLLGINPFDQPNVQEAKDRTSQILASGDDPTAASEGSLDELLENAEPPDYIAIQAFVDPARASELDPLVTRARESGCVVTVGLGPRYLHSTGQLHKGGPPTGICVQVVDETGEEIPIPGREFGFARLIRAQADGDLASLRERGRRVARIRLEEVS